LVSTEADAGTGQVNEAQNVMFTNITIHAESTSENDIKNTDGWNTYRSDNVTIKDSVIVNGDDCVSFKPSRRSTLVKQGTP